MSPHDDKERLLSRRIYGTLSLDWPTVNENHVIGKVIFDWNETRWCWTWTMTDRRGGGIGRRRRPEHVKSIWMPFIAKDRDLHFDRFVMQLQLECTEFSALEWLISPRDILQRCLGRRRERISVVWRSLARGSSSIYWSNKAGEEQESILSFVTQCEFEEEEITSHIFTQLGRGSLAIVSFPILSSPNKYHWFNWA